MHTDYPSSSSSGKLQWRLARLHMASDQTNRDHSLKLSIPHARHLLVPPQVLNSRPPRVDFRPRYRLSRLLIRLRFLVKGHHRPQSLLTVVPGHQCQRTSLGQLPLSSNHTDLRHPLIPTLIPPFSTSNSNQHPSRTRRYLNHPQYAQPQTRRLLMRTHRHPPRGLPSYLNSSPLTWVSKHLCMLHHRSREG